VIVDEANQAPAKSIYRLIDISINAHGSRSLAIVAHHDCAGNPVPDPEQIKQIKVSRKYLAQNYPQLEVIGLWLDEKWKVHEI
jgi:hypothetical protein